MTWALTMFASGPAQGGMANPSTVDFGSVPINTSANRNVAITIDAGYYIANVSGSGASAPFGFGYGTCVGVGGFVGPGTCTASASFSPPASTFLGVQNGTTTVLECPVAGGFCPSISYTVTGTPVSLLAANPPLVNFANVQVNTTASRNVTITIDAGYYFNGANGPPGGPFTFDPGTCAGTGNGFRGPGTCVANIGFTPAGLGTYMSYRDVIECTTTGMDCDVQVVHIDFLGNGVAVGPPNFLGAVSRKAHGSAGTFDLALSLALTSPTTEPRQGPAQSIVFTFDKPANAATATITEGVATASTPTFSGNNVIVNLTGVTNQQYVTVSLSSIDSSDGGTGGTASARIGFLAGDVSQNRVVTVADLGLVNAQLAQPVTAANYLKDVNANGTLTVADKGITNANLTKALPPP
jgi:hypothetical protein